MVWGFWNMFFIALSTNGSSGGESLVTVLTIPCFVDKNKKGYFEYTDFYLRQEVDSE